MRWGLPGVSLRYAAETRSGCKNQIPELLRRTIGLAAEGHKSAIMVGDSISDIAMAKAAKFPVIAVSYGYTEIPVSELAPDRIAGSFADVPPAVFEPLSEHHSRV